MTTLSKRVPAKIDNFGFFGPETIILMLTKYTEPETKQVSYNVSYGLIFEQYKDDKRAYPLKGINLATEIWNTCPTCAIKAGFDAISLIYNKPMLTNVAVIDPESGEQIDSFDLETAIAAANEHNAGDNEDDDNDDEDNDDEFSIPGSHPPPKRVLH